MWQLHALRHMLACINGTGESVHRAWVLQDGTVALATHKCKSEQVSKTVKSLVRPPKASSLRIEEHCISPRQPLHQADAHQV